LFEFRMNYLEPGYHKPGEDPFSFPPKDVSPKIGANLVQIEGRNGSGKTTLLNCLALATGYLEQEKELETKPALRRKLQDLEDNKTLEYCFRITCETPEHTELKIERAKGQKQKCWLNSKPIDTSTIQRKFDVIFLTEDDPMKVVSASLGKLARYFNDLERGLVSLNTSVTRNLQDIDEFREFKKREKELLKEINDHREKAKKKRKKLEKLEEKLAKAELKQQIRAKLDLLSSQDKITSDYKGLKKKYDALSGKTEVALIRKLYRERLDLKRVDDDLKNLNGRIEQICFSLKTYGVIVDSSKLLRDDYSQLNGLNRRMHPQQSQERVRIELVDEMVSLFRRYREDDLVPLVEKPVREAVVELLRIKARSASNRVFALLEALNKVMSDRKEANSRMGKVQTRISELSKKSREVQNIGEIQSEYLEAEKKYVDIQVVQAQNRQELLSQWQDLSLTNEDPSEVGKQVQELQFAIRDEDTLESKSNETLKLLRENAARRPEHVTKEKQLRRLFERISRLRENVIQWTQILAQPRTAREQFLPTKEAQGFDLDDYAKFVKSVGEYLGKQFEPVSFDPPKLHFIKFFDIENDTFTTEDDRKIPIEKLSQGQSKITTLTGSFKKMDSSKRKIVLIDEIADLDPQNLKNVKDVLKSKFDEGSLLLAVLVRPPSETSTQMIEVKGWG
jgi:energy-coupling factor transporter ATP-binding protein EcfA2